MNDIQKAKKIIEETGAKYELPIEIVRIGKGRYRVTARKEAVRRIRNETRLTLKEIAEIFGVSRQQIYIFCRNNTKGGKK